MRSHKPFTTIAAILFLVAAGVHVYRLVAGFPIVIGSHSIPMAVSWLLTPVAALLGVMLLRERRG